MDPRLLFLLLVFLLAAEADPTPISNITVIGAVFCDACSDNAFSKHSYFLQGAKVRVDCKFKPNPWSSEDLTVSADRTTDRFGIYRLDIPPVDGFECREGREIESSCRATLVESSSPLCSSPGSTTSAEHVTVTCRDPTICVFNLNALNYRPARRDAATCGAPRQPSAAEALEGSLFFWPPFGFPPFGFPPSLPFPFPSPPTLPFPFPSPPTLPFPFPSPPTLPFPFPSPPSLPFPFPSPPTLPFPFPSPPATPTLPFPFPSPPTLPFPFPSPPATPTLPFPFPSPPATPTLPFPFPSPPATPTLPFPFPSPPIPTPTPTFPIPPLPFFTPAPSPPPPPAFPFPFPPWFGPPVFAPHPPARLS